jgi:hypothetical protein
MNLGIRFFETKRGTNGGAVNMKREYDGFLVFRFCLKTNVNEWCVGGGEDGLWR